MTESEEALLKLARARFPDLKAQEETLVRAASSGTEADLAIWIARVEASKILAAPPLALNARVSVALFF